MSEEARAYHDKWIRDEKDLRNRYEVMQAFSHEQNNKAISLIKRWVYQDDQFSTADPPSMGDYLQLREDAKEYLKEIEN
jgi:hypothetical protein